MFSSDTGTREASERADGSSPTSRIDESERLRGGVDRSRPINSFEVFAVRVLLLRLQGLRILQEVFIPLVLRLDVGADGGGALALKASGQSCRTEAEEKQVQLGDSNRKKAQQKNVYNIILYYNVVSLKGLLTFVLGWYHFHS